MDRVGLLFPGQGSQFVGMGEDLYNSINSAKRLMDVANDILEFDIKSIMFGGSEEELRKTELAQPAIYIASAMYFEKFKEFGEEFFVVAGHSLGEYSALYASGVFSFEDGLRLVRKRGLAMGKQNSLGTMFAVIGIKLDELEKYLEETDGKTVIANVNSQNQIVISGYNHETIKIAEKLSALEGLKVVKLNVSSAFHSPLMQDAKEIMDAEIDNIIFSKPISYVIPNVTATVTKNILDIRSALKLQITGRVNWLDSILTIKNMEIEKLYEVGSGEVLKKLNKSITIKPKCLSL